MTDRDLPAITPEFPPKSSFRKWLRSLPADEALWERWNCHTCPLATWVRRVGISDAPYIRPDETADKSAWRFDAMSSIPLPEWANEFGKEIDRKGRRNSRPFGGGFGPVTAADCLRVLARTPRA